MLRKNNYAFIDSNNLYLNIKKLGWKIDYRKFRRYLFDKYDIVKAFMFLGYVESNEKLYSCLQRDGFTLIFKEVVEREEIRKGNCDAELVLQAAIELLNYDRALIVSGDGDFACLIKYLEQEKKLYGVLTPTKDSSSFLIKKAAANKIWFLDQLESKLAYKKKNTP